jgi:SEC-C motif
MATESQLITNRSNAQASTGPVTAEGKSRISRNAVSTGLFSAGDFVLRDETEIYAEFCAAYQADLAPAGPVEETFAAEIVHAAWRLRRCSTIEESIRIKDGAWNIEETLKSIERARAAAFRIFTRANTELRKIQAERRRPARGEAAPEKREAAPQKREAASETPSRQPAPVFAKQTQSDPAPAGNPVALTPRGAPCHCGSGLKFKRCCGKDAPPLLHLAA